MSNIIVPPPSQSLEHGGRGRARFRTWQIAVTLITLFLAVWFFTLHVGLGIAFAFLAKHILVGVLTAGMHYPRGMEEFTQPTGEEDAYGGQADDLA